MEWSDTALVLGVGRFRESDLWLRMLTRRHGIVSAFAFGGSRSRKRFCGCLDLFNELQISTKTTRNGMYLSLQEGNLIRGPRRLVIWGNVITPTIPLAFIGGVFVLSLLFGVNPVYELLGGGLMLGAFFMATDYTTSPITEKGKIIFGLGCALITMVIRVFGSYPEGVSYSILLMNIITPHINRMVRNKAFGGVQQ